MLYRILILFLLTTLSFPSSAEKATVLVIRKSKAPIYKKASFDSRILAYAPKGKKLYGTKKARPGVEGFGLFHKVRIKKGLYGYILDTDVVGFKKRFKKKSKVKKTPFSKKSSRSKSKLKKQTSKSSKASNMQKWKGYPLSFVKAVGFTAGVINYGFEFGGEDVSSNETSFGLKLSGPGWLFKSIPLDISLVAHFGGVTSLDDVTQGGADGMFILTDLTFPFRLKHSKSWSIYGGLGLLVNYSDFSFMLNNENKTSSGANVGVVGTLGFVLNKGDFLFKLEPKFYWDKSQFFGVLGSFQYIL